MFLKKIKRRLRLRKIKKALSGDDSFEFLSRQGFHVLNDFKEGEIIEELLRVKRIEKRSLPLANLAFVLSMELGGRYFSEKAHFEVPKVYEEFRDYMYYDENEITTILIGMGIDDRDEKEKVKGEYFKILRILLEEKRLGSFKEDEGYREWHTEVMRRGREM